MTDPDAEARRHKLKMAHRKAVQDAEVASKTVTDKGLLMVNTGPGKGKSTAAFGLVLRAMGYGWPVGVVQFIKGAWDTGERRILEGSDLVRWYSMGEGFTWETQDRARDVAAAEAAWGKSLDLMADPSIRLVVLDELNVALRYDYLPLGAVVAALKGRRPGLHVCVTGRNAKPELIEAADLVTEMVATKTSFRRRGKSAAGHRVLEHDTEQSARVFGRHHALSCWNRSRSCLWMVSIQRHRDLMAAKALMFQGTGSDVGKSLIVAGLARAFSRRGLAVRPFKPQNMSNNAAVTADGGEIGRAQALQARAAGVPPSVHMNPVLLKPQSEIGSQVVVQGRVIGNAKAREYQAWKPRLMEAVLDSFQRLRQEADLVLVEGAGSPAEVNLRPNDIANMGFARRADVPVVLIGDIDRGGVIAQIVGTKAVLAGEDAAMVAGFLVNKFRGDPTLFEDGIRIIEDHTGWPGLGLVPHFPRAGRLPAEDAVALAGEAYAANGAGPITVAVPVLPRISNFDDLDPLRLEPCVDLVMVRAGEPLPICRLVILPGSKATIADLGALRREGWDIDILAHARRGGFVLGLCGGYQMLGRHVADPEGIEGPPGACDGLGLLDVETVLGGHKVLRPVRGVSVEEGVPFAGYEMHVGDTRGPARGRPMLRFADGTPDGAVSPNGRVFGAYVHGLFADDVFRAAWLKRLGGGTSGLRYEHEVDSVLDALAEHLGRHVDLDRLLALAR